MHFYSKKEYLKKTPDQDNQITNIRPIKPIQNKTHSIYKYEINFSESNNPPTLCLVRTASPIIKPIK